jgi:hypothetical protein
MNKMWYSHSAETPVLYKQINDIERRSVGSADADEESEELIGSTKTRRFNSSPFWKISTFLLLGYSIFSTVAWQEKCKLWSPMEISKIPDQILTLFIPYSS